MRNIDKITLYFLGPSSLLFYFGIFGAYKFGHQAFTDIAFTSIFLFVISVGLIYFDMTKNDSILSLLSDIAGSFLTATSLMMIFGYWYVRMRFDSEGFTETMQINSIIFQIKIGLVRASWIGMMITFVLLGRIRFLRAKRKAQTT